LLGYKRHVFPQQRKGEMKKSNFPRRKGEVTARHLWDKIVNCNSPPPNCTVLTL
jgi:hypothetical protein